MKQLRPYQQEALDNLLSELKKTHEPLLVNASVGAGKSLIIAQLLLIMERSGYRSLCLTLNSTLIQQNADTYKLQGGDCGIYCAGLKSKCCDKVVVFASPHSVCQGIRNKDQVGRQPFKLIIVDEAHNISPHDNSSMFQRIMNHYGAMAQEAQYSFRIVGLTGTPYRGKGISIVADDQFFKKEICNISTSWLIEQGFLTRPKFGFPSADIYDFSQLRVNSMGKFDHKQLQDVIDRNERLTGKIMRELVEVMKTHNGAFIFAATRKHCYECARSLPDGQWAIILGETPHEERKRILNDAKIGVIRYLISVGCLNTGVDLPSFDLCIWLRPTESLVLYTQGIGRVLRLHPGKLSATILDYAGNLDRHGDIDNPIINSALQPREENEKDYVIPCYTCGTNNTVHARRCIGTFMDRRCDHYFEFKACPSCQIQNDITARACRTCDAELIDPNKKLKQIVIKQELQVLSAKYWLSVTGKTSYPIICASYLTKIDNVKTDDAKRNNVTTDNSTTDNVFESYFTASEKGRHITYAKFIKPHIENSGKYYTRMTNYHHMQEMLQEVKTPLSLLCKRNEWGIMVILEKHFSKNAE